MTIKARSKVDMNGPKKKNNEFYVSCEGETEKWYFEYLQKLINSLNIEYCVELNTVVEKSPLKMVRSINNIYKVNAFHICDYESNETVHVTQFQNTLKELKAAKKKRPYVGYKLGYSNFTFELWMILHKIQYNRPLSSRFQYLDGIKKAFGVDFESLEVYKTDKNFHYILNQYIKIPDVINAIKNAKKIKSAHVEANDRLVNLYGYKFYRDNPDLTIDECVGEILHSCKLI